LFETGVEVVTEVGGDVEELAAEAVKFFEQERGAVRTEEDEELEEDDDAEEDVDDRHEA